MPVRLLQHEASIPYGQDADVLGLLETVDLKRRYERIIELLSRDPQRYFGEPMPPVFSPVLTLRRPSSELIKCHAQSEGRCFGLYIKFFLVKKDSQEYHDRLHQRMKNDADITCMLYESLQQNPAHAVPRVIAFLPDERAIVMEESVGQQLLQLIIQKGRGYPSQNVLDELASYCHSLGGWLRNFQNLTRTGMLLEPAQIDLVDYVNLRLARLEKFEPFFKRGFSESIRQYLARLLQQTPIEETFACGVHSDLALSNILVTADQVTVLDFSMYQVGHFCNDIAYLYIRLEHLLYQPFFTKKTISILKESFLKGYDDNFDTDHPLFMAYYLRHKINRLADLSKTRGLSLIKRYYQNHQFRKCLYDLNRFIAS